MKSIDVDAFTKDPTKEQKESEAIKDKYINLEAYLKILYHEINKLGRYTEYECGLDDAYTYAENMELADVEPVKHAYWIEQRHEWDFGPPFDYTDYKCSICGSREQNRRNYCPECGAKMDEEEK